MESRKKPREFLDVPSDESDFTKLLSELSSKNMEISLSNEAQPKTKSIKPATGFCIKTRDDNNSKVFINICHCPDLPKPVDLSEEKLLEILASDEITDYRVPMSLGEPHEEVDKSGKKCTCYDVIINSEYYDFILKNELFRRFLISVSYEGIQDKYHVNIDGEACVVLKNKSYHGTIPDHHIRCKPLIVDLGNSPYNEKTDLSFKSKLEISNTKMEVLSKTTRPNYVLRKTPACGPPQKLILEVSLPNIINSESVSLSIGEDRIKLYERNHSYDLDIFTPYDIQQKECAATFNVCNKVLTLIMPTTAPPEKDER